MVLRLHGYGAWIESNGKPLEEYAVEVKGNVVSCYVCSEEGKEFVLYFDDDGSHPSQLTAPSDRHGRSIRIKVDGSETDRFWGNSTTRVKSYGLYVGDIVRPYVFAPIDTTDDDDIAAEDDPIIEHIGTIEAELKRAVRLGPGTGDSQRTGPGVGPIHERSKKAGSHRVAFGEGIYDKFKPVKTHYLDNAPWLIFRFLYRNRDMLKAHGILPQSPRPSPSLGRSPGPSAEAEGRDDKGVKRKREEDTSCDVIEVISDDDLGTLQDELERIQERIARKKAKRPVKREPVSPAGEVIDLT